MRVPADCPAGSRGARPITSLLLSVLVAMPAKRAAVEAQQQGGSGEGRDGEDPPGRALALGEVASFDAVVTGVRDTTYEASSDAGNIQPFGGCRAGRPMSMGFNIEPPGGVESGRFGWVTADPIGPGVTGSFPVDTASFWYPRMGAPSRTTFKGRHPRDYATRRPGRRTTHERPPGCQGAHGRQGGLRRRRARVRRGRVLRDPEMRESRGFRLRELPQRGIQLPKTTVHTLVFGPCVRVR